MVSRVVVLPFAFALLLLPADPAVGGGRFRGPVGMIARGPHRLSPTALIPDGIRPQDSGGIGADHWIFWWYLNRDAILADRFPAPPLSPGDAVLVDRAIVPVLHKALSNTDLHPFIRGRALIALARAGPDHSELSTILAGLRDREPVVRESAIFALAVLRDRDESVLARLRKIADDVSERSRERGFALLALGLLRDNSARGWACFLRRLDPEEKDEDVTVSAIIACGLVKDPRRVPELLGMLYGGRAGDRKLTDDEQARIVGALGRIGDPRALPVVMSFLTSEKGLPERRAAAIAVGRLVPRAGSAASHWFAKLPLPESIPDRAARELLLIALGRMATSLPPADRAKCRRGLLRVLASKSDAVERGYAALALGIGFSGDVGVADSLVRGLGSEAWSMRAAAALALGLLGDRRPATVNRLFRILEDPAEKLWTRGLTSFALGMLRAPGTAGVLAAALADRDDRTFHLDLATAVGLAPVRRFPNALLGLFTNPRANMYRLCTAADAVGRTREFRLLRPLMTILEPATVNGWYPDIARAFSAVALGLLGDRRGGDVLVPLSEDLDWLQRNPVLADFLWIR